MPTIARYTLDAEIAAGGMATIWRAHAPDGSPVAIKLIRSDLARDDAFRQALRDEVHLTARLNHPGIIQLHAWGETTPAEATALSLQPGAPWIAMELANHQLNSLDVGNWPAFVHLATTLLSALMHSHARGVIHRDLKPGNVLVSSLDGRDRFFITDFGIAFPSRQKGDSGITVRAPMAGTLGYMAPEQLLGRWRDFGPYTDLFSLGVLLFHVVSGAMPFDAKNRIELGLQHQRGAAPLTTTRFSVPAGLKTWLSTLLAFDPQERFAFAADAAHGLALLGDPDNDRAATDSASRSAEIPTLAWTSTPTVTTLDSPVSEASWGARVHIGGPLRAPIRDDWRGTHDDRESTGAPSAAGLRRTPMTGREAEREVMWAALVGAIRDGSARGLVLRGSSGMGKSSLARWLCERAHELGMADSTRLLHSAGTASLPDLIKQEFRLDGLSPLNAMLRLQEILELAEDDPDLAVIGRMLSAESVGLGEQTMLLGRITRYFAARRPVIIWLDDVHWSLEAIEAAAALTDLEVPILFLLSVRDEDLAELPIHDAQLRDYAQLERVDEVRLHPLSDDEMAELLDRTMPIDPALRAALTAQSRGNPLHALQTLQLSLDRGDSQVDDDGCVRGVIGVESRDELWLQRLARADIVDRDPVLVAAVLGMRVDPDTWEAVCARLGLMVDSTLAHQLVEAGLWVPAQDSWLFEHASLRDALLAEAADTEKLRGIHRAVAEQFDPDGSQTFISHGFHLLRGGDVSRGVDVLLSGLSWLYAEARGLTARSVLHGIDRLLEGLDVSAYTRTQLTVAEAGVAYESARHADALRAANECFDLAMEQQWWELASNAQNVRACVFESRRDLPNALDAALHARQLANDAGDDDAERRAACRVGWCLARMNRNVDAVEQFEFALAADRDVVRDRAHIGLASVCEATGDFAAAGEHLQVCIDFARQTGRRAQLADALNSRASLAIAQGDLEAAHGYFEDAYRNARLERSMTRVIVLLNWSTLRARMGHADDAWEKARLATTNTVTDDHFVLGYAELAFLSAAAAGGWTKRWDLHVAALHEPSFHGDLEFAELYMIMAAAWAGHGDSLRATAARAAATRAAADIDHPRAREICGGDD